MLAARRRDASAPARDALTALCETYWYPLYAYVRRRGYDADRARDLTQGFFARLLEKEGPLDVRPELGRFRCYLLGALKHYLGNEWDRERAAKRGGGLTIASLDFETGENRYRLEPSHDVTPERIYEHRWALTLLDEVLGRLEAEKAAAGKGKVFLRLKPFLTGDGERGSYMRIARELSMSETALKVAVHRLRRRYRALLRAEIGETVARPEDVDDELRHLLAAVSR